MKYPPPFALRLSTILPSPQRTARIFRLRGSAEGRRLPRVPAIVVRGGQGADLLEQVNPDEKDGTCFGRTVIGDGVVRTFSIHNVGTAPLKLGRIGLEGTGADQFEIASPAARVVAPGSSARFTIRYRPRRAGRAAALVLLPSNDATERPYLFLVEGHAAPARP